MNVVNDFKTNCSMLYNYLNKIKYDCIGHIIKVKLYVIFNGLNLIQEHDCRHVLLESDSWLTVRKMSLIDDKDPQFHIYIWLSRTFKKRLII